MIEVKSSRQCLAREGAQSAELDLQFFFWKTSTGENSRASLNPGHPHFKIQDQERRRRRDRSRV